jgi:dTDP-glucose pyrophosphorylase
VNNQMQIIIPMSGFGERFRKFGYDVPKPLIVIEGKPIIAHVIDMFPGEVNFFFICNQDHLDNQDYNMREILKTYCPSGTVFGIEPHKLGPVHAVRQIMPILDKTKPTIVNYCDFTCYWDWQNFKKFVQESACLGAIPAYKGFHPHSLGNTNYAYLKESDGWVQDIQEKQPYTDNRMDEYASSGTYYFATAELMGNTFSELVSKNLHLAGEFYVSLAYKVMCQNNMSVAVYPLQHFMQWGTPEDVTEYNYWSKTFSRLADSLDSKISLPGASIIPMAGLGKRFSDEGYVDTKPLIPVSGTPMVIQAANYLPNVDLSVFVARADMPDYIKVKNAIDQSFPNSLIKTIDGVTEGQACTAMIGVQTLQDSGAKNLSPITIGTCDSGALYDEKRLLKLLNDDDVDVIVWGIRGYANAIRNPEMFGWIDSVKGKIRAISVKKPLLNPRKDPIVLGTFTFKKIEDFHNATEKLLERGGRINGEFYMDSCIEDAIALGLKCVLFEVDSYLCWGTPNDLKTFEYWQSCFHLWNGHPYSLHNDVRIENCEAERLEAVFIKSSPIKEFTLRNKP